MQAHLLNDASDSPAPAPESVGSLAEPAGLQAVVQGLGALKVQTRVGPQPDSHRTLLLSVIDAVLLLGISQTLMVRWTC